MNNQHALYLHSEQRRYEAALSSWASQVRTCHDLRLALKLARHAPPSGAVLAGMRHLTKDGQNRAVQKIDDTLAQRLRQSKVGERGDLLRLARGMPQFRKITAWVSEETRLAIANQQGHAG